MGSGFGLAAKDQHAVVGRHGDIGNRQQSQLIGLLTDQNSVPKSHVRIKASQMGIESSIAGSRVLTSHTEGAIEQQQSTDGQHRRGTPQELWDRSRRHDVAGVRRKDGIKETHRPLVRLRDIQFHRWEQAGPMDGAAALSQVTQLVSPLTGLPLTSRPVCTELLGMLAAS
jgi:hypothetical protein